jgi:hypothetical protein
LTILLFIIYVPTIGVLAATGFSWSDAQREPQMFIYPVLHLAFFAAAMSMTCLTRHAVYAAILSIPAALVGPALIYSGYLLGVRIKWPNTTYLDEWWATSEHRIAALYIGSFLISFVANILLAWLAMRFDWGQKGRY